MASSMPEMRRRGAASAASEPRATIGARVRSGFKQLDVYPKLESDRAVRTRVGGAVTIATAAVCLILFLSEVAAALAGSRRDELIVDTSNLTERLAIRFNVTFHALTCAEVSVDAMDVAGEQQIGVQHAISKTRVAPSGDSIGESFPSAIAGQEEALAPLPDNYCGPCFGAKPDGVVRSRLLPLSSPALSHARSAATRATTCCAPTRSAGGTRSR
jgi:hypothetical protein